MKMVSAAKLRRTQNKIINLRPYANNLSFILTNLLLSKVKISSIHWKKFVIQNGFLSLLSLQTKDYVAVLIMLFLKKLNVL